MKNTTAIKENRVFRALYAKGKTCASKTIAVYTFKNRLKTGNRLGITVSVKLGGAVVRNRARRRIKEAYRLNEGLFKSGYDIVIVARKRACDAPFDELCSDLRTCLARLSLLKDCEK